MKYAMGVDIGGTKISITLGNEQGKILTRHILPTRTGKSARQGINELFHGIEEILRSFACPSKSRGLSPAEGEARSPRSAGGAGRRRQDDTRKVVGIGVGIPGPVDSKKGIIPVSPHLDGWNGMPLQRWMEKRFEVPVVLANDANAAALGEKCFGQGRGLRDFIYMTVSTGIGGGIVANGQLVEGASYVAGEVGHMTIVPEGDACKCGKLGCLEAYASGTAMAHFAQELFRKGKKSKTIERLAEGGPITAKVLGQAVKKRDPVALEVYERAGYYLGIGIANLLNILNPQKVILGGGVMKSAPSVFWRAMKDSCKNEAWPEAMKAVQIVRSKLRGFVGDLGALALVFERRA